VINIKFTKMHGCGNDFILIDGYNEDLKFSENMLPELTKKMCDRHFGIGADGVLLVLPPIDKSTDFKMRIFNADGSEGEMCGNGLRCASKYFWERIKKTNNIEVETKAGIMNVVFNVKDNKIFSIAIDMGIPKFRRQEIPALPEDDEFLLDLEVDLSDPGQLHISAVNTGVPHTVVFVNDVNSVNVQKIGRALRYYKLFPKGTNVDFVETVSDSHLKVRTYERGVEGETICCGTGATAAVAVGILLGKINKNNEIKVEFPGGTVYLLAKTVDEELRGLIMIGTASKVFEGIYSPD